MTNHSEASEPAESVPADGGECARDGGSRVGFGADVESARIESAATGRESATAHSASPAEPEHPGGDPDPDPDSQLEFDRVDAGPVGARPADSTPRGIPPASPEPIAPADPMLSLSHYGRPGSPEAAVHPMPGGTTTAPHIGRDGRAKDPGALPGHAKDTPGGLPPEQVTLRSATELADALPYLLGYRPEDSVVLVAVHDREGYGSFGARARLGIPQRSEDWPGVARQMARCLVSGCERRGTRPEGMVAFVCREPEQGRTGRQVAQTLRPLAQALRTECGSLDIPVLEALCISDGRFWSYCCPGPQCCPEDGTPLGLPGSSVLSAAMTYAGLQVRGTLKEFRARLTPWESAAALDQQAALDAAGMTLAPRILDDAQRSQVAADTLDLGRRLMGRLADAPRMPTAPEADRQDDEIVAYDEAAAVIFGLQDRTTRDRAAEWMEGDVAPSALRLWRTLARRCVGPYGEYAAAPLTLAGWVAWSTGDELEGREALAMALGAQPDYVLARLLHQACNEGVSPEAIRRCLRRDHADRTEGIRAAASADLGPVTAPGTAGPRAASSLPGPAPRTGRRPRSGSAARRGPRSTRPTSPRGAATGPGAPRPSRRRRGTGHG